MSAPLSARRKSDREKMAALVAELARAHGAQCALQHDDSSPRAHATYAYITAARGLSVRVAFEAKPPTPGAYVLSWHMNGADASLLAAGAFASVNPHHFRKATDIAYGFDALCEVLALRLEAARSGRAFQPAQAQPAPAN
jgi:hypothetical protein